MKKILDYITNGAVFCFFAVWAFFLLNPTLLNHYWSSEKMVNINNASKEQLIDLPGVGEKLAGRIIQTRQDNRIKNEFDLQQIQGIGYQRCLALRHYIQYKE